MKEKTKKIWPIISSTVVTLLLIGILIAFIFTENILDGNKKTPNKTIEPLKEIVYIHDSEVIKKLMNEKFPYWSISCFDDNSFYINIKCKKDGSEINISKTYSSFKELEDDIDTIISNIDKIK